MFDFIRPAIENEILRVTNRDLCKFIVSGFIDIVIGAHDLIDAAILADKWRLVYFPQLQSG